MAEVPEGMIAVPGSDLYFDPSTQSFMSYGATPAAAPNQWAWGDQGLQGAGSGTPYALLDSFLSVQDKYRGGAPITADTWQDAVRQSLTGFVRANYGLDPIFNWDPSQSGNQGSQFRMGTVQELANQYPGFFDTTGNLQKDISTGEWGLGHGQAASFDPLLGLNPQDKVLGFEDIPFEQIEKMVGGMPGSFLNPEYTNAFRSTVQPLEQQLQELNKQRTALPEKDPRYHAQRTALDNQLAAVRAQYDQARGALPGQFLDINQARSQFTDFNDLLFKLNIDQYAPPAPIVRATPESVMQQFFDTAPYRLAFGNDPEVLDASLDPTERFRFDPGYQFAQDEGLRQLQFDQSKRGLLESGRGARDIQQFSQGLADQNYQRYLAQNMGLFTDWTNRIQGISNQGAAASGQMSQNDMTLSQLLGALSSQTGGNLANLTGQTGTNVANLFGNQGVFGASSYLNTGAAQGSNIMQSGAIQAQIAAANASAQAAGAGASGGGGGGKGGAGQAIGQVGSLLGGLI